MGATSAVGGERLARPRTREAYRRWLEKPQPVGAGAGMPLDELLLVGLRRREGVVLPIKQGEALEKRWTTFLEQGLLQKRSGRWQLRDPEGMALSNRVLLEVVLWWESVQQPTSVEPPQTAAAQESGPG